MSVRAAFSDYVGKDVRGKIVLTELSYAPPRPEKTRIAMINGAAGMLIMNWGSDDNPLISHGTVKAVWGNPTPETIGMMDNTPPVLSITRRDGVYLRKLLENGETVRVHMETKGDRDWLKFYMPYAEVKAQEGNGDYVLVAGHMDSWAKGASDNASGNSIKMEIARVLQQNRHLLKRDVRFAFWQGHENGIMEGSTYFVDKFWDDLDENCVAEFTYDAAGMKGASLWHAESSSELFNWHREIEEVYIPEVQKRRIRVRRTGDQSFFGVGIPLMNNWMMHSEEKIKEWHNAILGEWYHSEADTLELLDMGVMEKCRKLLGAYAFEMASARVLPMNFVTVADDMIGRVYELQEMISKRSDAKELLELDDLMKYCQLFRKKAQGIENFKKIIASEDVNDAQHINKILMKLSRVLSSALHTVSGRHEQDSYGLTALDLVFPGSDSIQKLVSFPSGSHEYYLWSTRARRERNRITDAVRHAIEICNTIF